MKSENFVLGLIFTGVGISISVLSNWLAKLSVQMDETIRKKVNPFQVKFRMVIYLVLGLVLLGMGLKTLLN